MTLTEHCVCQSRAQEGGEAWTVGSPGRGGCSGRGGDTGPPATPGAAGQTEQLCQQVLQYGLWFLLLLDISRQ